MEWLTREWIKGCLRQCGYSIDENEAARWEAEDRVDWFSDALADTVLTAAERRYAEAWGERLRVSGDLQNAVIDAILDTVREFTEDINFDCYIYVEPLFDGLVEFVEDALFDDDFWAEVDCAVAEALHDWVLESIARTVGNERRE